MSGSKNFAPEQVVENVFQCLSFLSSWNKESNIAQLGDENLASSLINLRSVKQGKRWILSGKRLLHPL